ncbi:hypothetical protein VP01_5770g1, partial [Puccinia sorghi]
LQSHNQAINSIQDILEGFQLADTSKLRYIFLIHNLIQFSTITLKQWRSLNRTQFNLTNKRKRNFKRLYLRRNNSTIMSINSPLHTNEITTMMVSLHGAGFIHIFIPQLFLVALLPPLLNFYYLYTYFVKLNLSFNLSNPFKPFEKLRELIISLESPIFDLYPLLYSKMDLNGKNFHWKPF